MWRGKKGENGKVIELLKGKKESVFRSLWQAGAISI